MNGKGNFITPQKTIKKSISINGTGIHTGSDSVLVFHPAPINYGIKFVRTDLEGSPEIPAEADYVVDVSRGTTLAKGEAKVHTAEHVLAAVVGLEIDNIRIELKGVEPPIGDGSSVMFAQALLSAGIEEQDSPKDYLIVEETIEYVDEARGVQIVALPTDDFRITVMIDYKNPVLGSQHTGLFSLEREFLKEFAPARTFCFLHEVEDLINQGLIKGGDLDTAIVIVDKDLTKDDIHRISKKLNIDENIVLGTNGILMNKELRFKNEPARHKLLDLLGDLALVGAPLKAQILAARPGHSANVEFAKKIRKVYQTKKLTSKYQDVSKKGVVFDINAIQKILPHRYPFLLVDRIIELEPGKRIIGIKNVTANEPFFIGHFPGQPVMPGVLILEAMAQVGGILLLNQDAEPGKHLVYFTGIDECRFRKTVSPGDQLVFELEMLKYRKSTCKMSGRAYVGGDLVAEAELMAAVVDR
jgi:UDP-3-O-[3-hydroxymyristoyl] N-acetylglucosamine deacetylase/3-hydroxyacyl-[acyl-carrier-protein] dehydratase